MSSYSAKSKMYSLYVAHGTFKHDLVTFGGDYTMLVYEFFSIIMCSVLTDD